MIMLALTIVGAVVAAVAGVVGVCFNFKKTDSVRSNVLNRRGKLAIWLMIGTAVVTIVTAVATASKERSDAEQAAIANSLAAKEAAERAEQLIREVRRGMDRFHRAAFYIRRGVKTETIPLEVRAEMDKRLLAGVQASPLDLMGERAVTKSYRDALELMTDPSSGWNTSSEMAYRLMRRLPKGGLAIFRADRREEAQQFIDDFPLSTLTGSRPSPDIELFFADPKDRGISEIDVTYGHDRFHFTDAPIMQVSIEHGDGTGLPWRTSGGLKSLGDLAGATFVLWTEGVPEGVESEIIEFNMILNDRAFSLPREGWKARTVVMPPDQNELLIFTVPVDFNFDKTSRSQWNGYEEIE